MKNFLTGILFSLIGTSMFGQTPEKMSYQAILRDANNALVVNQQIGMQISILQGETAVYEETQTPTTNSNGLVSIEIGDGAVVSGDFSQINWAEGTYFVKTATDLSGGSTYTLTTTSQLLSVPYALHAKSAESIKGNDYVRSDATVELTGAISNGINTLTSANGNISWTGSEGNLYQIILTEDATLENPSSPILGATYMFLINQDATGQWTLSYEDLFLFPNGNTPIIDLNPNSKNLMTTIFDGTHFLVVSIQNFL